MCRRHPGRDPRKQTHWLASSIGGIRKHMSCSARMTVESISVLETRHIIIHQINYSLNAAIPIQPDVPERDCELHLLLSPQTRRLHGRVRSLFLSHEHQWCTVHCVSFVSRHHLDRGLWSSSCVQSAWFLRHSRSSRYCGLPYLGLTD